MHQSPPKLKKTMKKLSSMARKFADRAKLRQANRMKQLQAQRTERLNSRGQYAGYDDGHLVRLQSGQTVLAEPLTNAGLKLGDRVLINRTSGKNYLKAMPQ